MAKTPKKTQTEYTIGGHDISQTAIPLYQENLKRMGEYLENPQARQEKYLRDYYDSNTQTSDFLTNYKRAMAEQTGQNYSATTGGYTSTGQRNYDDLQRYQDQFAAYLRDQGVKSAYDMASSDYLNMLRGNADFQNAYNLGKEYSDIVQHNYMADQVNSFGNQLLGIGGSALQGVGAVASAFNPALGMGLMAAGNGLGSFQTQMPGASASTSTSGVGAYGGMFGGKNGITGLQSAISARGLWGNNPIIAQQAVAGSNAQAPKYGWRNGKLVQITP